jgi:hypothetical protein
VSSAVPSLRGSNTLRSSLAHCAVLRTRNPSDESPMREQTQIRVRVSEEIGASSDLGLFCLRSANAPHDVSATRHDPHNMTGQPEAPNVPDSISPSHSHEHQSAPRRSRKRIAGRPALTAARRLPGVRRTASSHFQPERPRDGATATAATTPPRSIQNGVCKQKARSAALAAGAARRTGCGEFASRGGGCHASPIQSRRDGALREYTTRASAAGTA